MNRKTPDKVLGRIMNCPNYEMCPLCYGCRAYDPGYIKCDKCAENKKYNICNRQLHRPDLLAKMIKRERIVIRGKDQ